MVQEVGVDVGAEATTDHKTIMPRSSPHGVGSADKVSARPIALQLPQKNKIIQDGARGGS